MSASGFDMDVGVVLFLVVLAIWMFAIWRDYNERRTHHKS
jgi:preprotein translocase subunit YajC